jgi:hypothetical protein
MRRRIGVADLAGGIADVDAIGGQIAADQAAGADDGVLADPRRPEHGHARRDPDALFEDDVASLLGIGGDVDKDWRRLARNYVHVMQFNNYPTKWQLRRIARSAGVAIRFVEADEFMFREGRPRKTRILSALRKVGLERVVVRIAGLVMLQRYMILQALS